MIDALDCQDTLAHLIVDDGKVFAGKHVLIDLYGAYRLDDLEWMGKAFDEAIHVTGATELHRHLHHFGPNQGVSGVAVLAESHLSVHTWPEVGYASFDVYMCGDAKPALAAQVFEAFFKPSRQHVKTIQRGIMSDVDLS